MKKISDSTPLMTIATLFFLASISAAQTTLLESKGKVLVIVSSATQIALQEGGTYPVGLFLGELTEPAEALLKAGYELTFASPGGKAPTVDHDSIKARYFGFSKTKLKHAQEVWQDLLAKGLSAPLSLEEVAQDDSMLEHFDALFVPGGHGPLVDLFRRNAPSDLSMNSDMGRILFFFHQQNRPTGLICHAPVALAAAPSIAGTWIYSGYKMTGISSVSDFLNEDFPLTKIYPGHEIEHVEDILRAAGADYQSVSTPMIPFVVEDRELMTGQDPFAAGDMAKKFLRKVESYVAAKTGSKK